MVEAIVPGVLVACLDEGTYFVATRQLMTIEQAEKYVKSIHPSRQPIIIHPNRNNWDLRPVTKLPGLD